MRLPKIALHNYRFVFILILLASLLGLYSFFTMSRSEDPKLSLPEYTITAVYNGTSPKDMEALIVDPIEKSVDDLGQIKQIYSTITEGLAVIHIETKFGGDYDKQFRKIQSKVNAVRPQMPKNMQSLKAEQYHQEDRTSIMQLALISNGASWYAMHDKAKHLQDRLKRLPGLQKAKIKAYPKQEIQVSLDFQKMARQHISLDQVIKSMRGENANLPGGSIQAGDKSFTVKVSGSYDQLNKIKSTVIASANKKNIQLRDISHVSFTNHTQRWIGRYNGKRALFLSITRKPGVNLVTLTHSINKLLKKYKKELPKSMVLKTAFEQAPAVSHRVNGFFINLLEGVALVGFVIFLFLGARSSYIIILLIPATVFITIGLLNMYGYGLQQISIASLVIALGLLVDDGIVVVENIIRFRKQGHSPLQAAAKGTAEVGYAVVSSSVTTILAFAPLAFMQSGAGEFLRSLPVTVITALCISLLLALILTPILSEKFLQVKKRIRPRRIKGALERAINNLYEPALQYAMQHGRIIVSIAIFLLVGAGFLFPHIGVSFFPKADKPMLLIEVDAPNGVSINRTDQAVRYVGSVLDTTDFVKNYTSNTGHGNPQVYYNRVPKGFEKRHGEVLVNFKSWDPSRFYTTLNQFRHAFKKYTGARIFFRELKNGAPFKAPINIRILGDNIDSLRTLSKHVQHVIQHTPGTQNVNNPLAVAKTALYVKVNHEKASMLHVPLARIDRAVRTAVAGITIGQTTMQDDKKYPIVLNSTPMQHPGIPDLNKISIASITGEHVPLLQFATLGFRPTPTQLWHYDLQRSTSITANVRNPNHTTAITQSIVKKLDHMNWPQGYSYHVAGELKAQQQSFGDLLILLGIALVGIFAVLVLQFKSFRQPLIVFSAIPLAVTGSFVALFLTGWSFSFFAFVGFISLMGIVVNNSIILVDYANLLRKKGQSCWEAIQQACKTRFTPILLTTTTTITGLLPLTLSNSGLWSPLGWTIIGGMISSTLLTLFIVPILYYWLSTEDFKLQKKYK